MFFKKELLLMVVSSVTAACTFIGPYPDNVNERVLKLDGVASDGEKVSVSVERLFPLTPDSTPGRTDPGKLEAVCTVLRNGKTLDLDNSENPKTFVSSEAVKSGDQISLAVEVPGFPAVSCEITVPEVPVVNVESMGVDKDGFVSCIMRLARNDKTEYFAFSLTRREVLNDYIDDALVDQTVVSEISYPMFIKDFQGPHIKETGFSVREGSFWCGICRLTDKLLAKRIRLSSEVPSGRQNSYRRKDEDDVIHLMKTEWVYRVGVMAISEPSYMQCLYYLDGSGYGISETGFQSSNNKYTNIEGGCGFFVSNSSPVYSDWITITVE